MQNTVYMNRSFSGSVRTLFFCVSFFLTSYFYSTRFLREMYIFNLVPCYIHLTANCFEKQDFNENN